MGTAVIIGDSREQGMLMSGMIGTVGGLVTAGYLSRNWDVPESPVGVSLLPTTDLGSNAISGAQIVATIGL